ncbi:SHOCT domain-containing protein [Thalassomonas viridans]|uniref:SHOCT domain-containing protein n=1 Tax=Thalassomonas viridans TaxID=137584 RepID=A0AAE9Z2W5_9GAMM|nr:SHOCT domain-containing protein [Thalassomonas viridans]WDE05044.1 SHOCT domain-containing protein [Thalassomonas viridans]
MINQFKRCFGKALGSVRRSMLLFFLGYQIPGLSASSSFPEASRFAEQRIFIILALLLLLIFLLVRYRKGRYGLSSLPRKQYAYLEVSKSKQQIGLYRQHQTNTNTVLNIKDVISSKIMLNDKLINLVTREQADTFDTEQEKLLLDNFARTQSERMLDGQLRTVNLVLTDKQQKRYVICLYLRAGNKRLTKTRYQDVVEDVLEWCRLLSSQINNYHNPQTPPATAKTSPLQVEATPASQQETEPAQAAPKPQEQQEINNKFMSALERLVKLKQEGLLSDSEFSRAKEKLLDTPEK